MATDKSTAMDTFKRFDIDNNGLISYDELEALFSEIGGFASNMDLRKIIESVSSQPQFALYLSVYSFKCAWSLSSFLFLVKKALDVWTLFLAHVIMVM